MFYKRIDDWLKNNRTNNDTFFAMVYKSMLSMCTVHRKYWILYHVFLSLEGC